MNLGRKNWDEFQWEREIRRDERRISCYFRELSHCLDLPGEESIILENMMEQPGLVPVNITSENWRIWSDIDNDLDDNEDEEESLNTRTMSDALSEELDKIIYSWNIIFAKKILERNLSQGLAVSCSLSKLFVRATDFAETETKVSRGLKICLGKRTLHDINEVLGMLFSISEQQNGIAHDISRIVDELQNIRERILDQIKFIRQN